MRRLMARPVETVLVLLLGAALYLAAPPEPVAQEAECGWGNGPICATSTGCYKFFCWNIILYYENNPAIVEEA